MTLGADCLAAVAGQHHAVLDLVLALLEHSEKCVYAGLLPAALVKAVEEYRADWANKEMYFREARAFFDRELSMKVVTAQLADILKRMGLG